MPSDPTLHLPTAPVPQPLLSGPEDPLARAGPARPLPFLLAVAGCSARGTESRAVEAVEQDGRLLLGALGVDGAACGNVLLAPAHGRRELIHAGGSLLETLLVDGNGFIARWVRPEGAANDALDLRLALPAQEGWRTEGPFLRADGVDGVRLMQLQPAPTWRVREEHGGLLVAATVPVPPEGVMLLAASGSDVAEAELRLRGLGDARGARAEAEILRLRTARLRTRTGVEDIDDAIAWAAARIDAAGTMVHELASGEAFPLDPEARQGWTALGALASDGRIPRTDPGSPLTPLVVARTAAWRGSRIPTAVLAEAIATAEAVETTGTEAARVAVRAGLLELADAVEPWEGEAAAEKLRTRAAALGAVSAPRGTSLRLPTLGAGRGPGRESGDPVAAALAAALDLPGRPPFEPPLEDPPQGLSRALTAWACLAGGRTDRGFALFRQHLADGFASGAGLWPEKERIHDPAAAALVPPLLLFGLLGARADAHYGRLRLAPRLPSHWTRFVVAGMRMGDAEVRMEYEAGSGGHTFRFAQKSGRVPVMLIFEPLLPVQPGAAVHVDGERADVEVRSSGERAEARLQLPLDAERTVRIGG